MYRADMFMCWRDMLYILARARKVLLVHSIQPGGLSTSVFCTSASSFSLTAHQVFDGAKRQGLVCQAPPPGGHSGTNSLLGFQCPYIFPVHLNHLLTLYT